MIKHTLTKKQQLVLCAMYVESLADNPQAFHSWSRVRQICITPNVLYASASCMRCLMSYGLVGDSWIEVYYLTPDGVALAKALFKVLS